MKKNRIATLALLALATFALPRLSQAQEDKESLKEKFQ